jgi:hypothetical protein
MGAAHPIKKGAVRVERPHPTSACALFSLHLRLLILSFRGTLETLQGVFYAGGDCFRPECFEKPTPPAWWEDEVSAILDAAGGGIDGVAGDVRLLLQSQWEKSMQAELVPFGIDLLNLEGEAQGAAKVFPCEVEGLADAGWTFWLSPFYLDTGPFGIAFPLYEVLPDHLDRRRDDRSGTDCQAHRMFLLTGPQDANRVRFLRKLFILAYLL